MPQNILVHDPLRRRLDQYLSNINPEFSRTQIVRWIKTGNVLVNAKKVKASYRVEEGDKIYLSPPPIAASHLEAENIPLDILFEDKDLVVINKSSNMVVHPGAGHRSGTLTHALLAHCGQLSTIGGVERPGIVHRLDKGTSGVILVAKNDATHRALAAEFKEHEVKKIYWALVYGTLKNNKGKIQSLLARSPRHRKKFSTHATRGKVAITHYEVINEFNGISFLEIGLQTGRTHQIRVHFTESGHGLVGDPLYGNHDKRWKQIKNTTLKNQLAKLTHPLLHARSLEFTHPASLKRLVFEAPLPPDFQSVLDLCISNPDC